MKKRKLLKKFGLGSMLCLVVSSTLVAAACSVKGTPGVFRYFYNTDVLKDNNSPLSPTFNNSPISTYAGTILYNLVTYETTIKDQAQGSDDGTTTYQDHLILEAASKLEVFTSEEQMKTYDAAVKSRNASAISKNEPYTFNPGSELSTQSNYDTAISTGTIYRFTINTNDKWVDSNGNVMDSLSGKDFERAIETYKLASAIGYNRNGYFLSLMGLDFDKTVGMTNNSKQNIAVTDPSYDVENYKNTDTTFTLYITEPYPYTLDLLSKEYFAAIPHNNQKVKNITVAKDSPIVVDITETSSGGKSYMLNTSETNFNQLYGSGDIYNFTKDVWYAGSYYISSFTATQIIFQLNPNYFDSKVMGNHLLNKNVKHINKIIETYGSGTVDTYYELFKSGQNDYLASVPSTKKSEAAKLYVHNGLNLVRTSKINQSNYITFTPKPYVVDSSGISVNSYVTNMTANFINNWNSEDSTIIRAGIAGLINHQYLSLINLPSSGDFQLSSIPFGALDNYYNLIASSSTSKATSSTPLLGGLPRPYSDYQVQQPILSSFEMPIYKFNSNGVTIEQKEVSIESFRQALRNIGASDSNPLILSAKFGEGTFTTNYNNYLVSLKSYIEQNLGGRSTSNSENGLIRFVINARNGSSPTANQWYNNQSSPIGFSYWSPDYNGVGTWLEAYTLLGTTVSNGKSIEGNPSSNSHSSWLTYFEAMVTAVKMLGATAKEKTTSSQEGSSKENIKLYELNGSTNITNGNDPYKNDNKIQGAFNNQILEKFGIKFDEKTEEQSNEKDSTDSVDKINSTDSPGVKFGKLAIQFLNYLIENNVINQTKFQEYVDNPSKLNTTGNPKTVNDVIIGNDVFVAGNSANFSKYLGVFAGQSIIKGLWATTVNDSDYSYIPRSENGLNELTFSLVNPNYTARVSTVSSLNFRDFSEN